MKTRIAVALVVGLAVPAVVAADVIRLKNGRSLEVEGWRDAGDSIEFAAGGGIVRISKSEVDKIDGKPRRGELPRMYTSGVSTSEATAAATAPATGGQAGPVSQMRDLLSQGDGLFDQAALSAAEKASAFRRLGERWREFDVPEALREAHEQGRLAFQSAVAAFSGDSADPSAKLRVDKARAEVRSVLETVKKLAPAG